MSPETTTLLHTTINNRALEIEIESREMLIELLRDRLELTGTKRSCDSQVCGACTVLLDGQPVSSCCTLAYEAEGKAVQTIEGLSQDGHLDPIQAAFVEKAAIQCGFCTPGFVMTTKAMLAENPRPTRDEIKAYLGGNLCRCTGYWNILDAAEDAARRLSAEAEVGS